MIEKTYTIARNQYEAATVSDTCEIKFLVFWYYYIVQDGNSEVTS